jgi:transposase
VSSDGSAATAMLGMAGFRVLAVSSYGGECEQAVETIAGEAFCAGCGVRAVLHDRRPVQVRDLPAAGRPVVLCWIKRVWRCREPLCAVVTWTETHEAIRARHALTERARRWACERVGRDAADVDDIAAQLGVAWRTVMAAVREYGEARLAEADRLAGVCSLGVDETAFLAGNREHPTMYVTGFVDLDRGRLLDVAPDRSSTSVSGWLGAQPARWRDGIETVALDPHAGYLNGLRAGFGDRAIRGLAAPTLVIDHFHAIKLANAAIDDARRRTQNQTLGHRGCKPDPLYRIRRVLLRGADRPTPRA